jgi:membrane protease YdiL (CAAX protease family)
MVENPIVMTPRAGAVKSPLARGKEFIAQHQLITFFILSYAFFWLFLVFFVLVLGLLRLKPDSLPSWLMPVITILGSWMPNAAATIVTGVLQGREGIGKLFRKFIQFKLPARWYIAALLPLGLAFAAAGIYRLAGGITSGGSSLSLSFWFMLIVVTLLEGSTGEEAGWRGFALPRFMERYSPLKAGVILGILWAFWHLPLWFASGYSSLNLVLYCLSFSVGIISLSVLMTWIFCKTSYSLVPMVVAHFSFDAGYLLIGTNGTGLSLVPTVTWFAIMAALLLVTAIIVWAAGGLSVRPIYKSA